MYAQAIRWRNADTQEGTPMTYLVPLRLFISCIFSSPVGYSIKREGTPRNRLGLKVTVLPPLP